MTEAPQTELAACPFCGDLDASEVVEFIGVEELWSVRCPACDAEGPYKYDRKEAIAAWNARPSPLVDTGEALREARELLAMVPAQELPVQRHLDALAKIDAALAAHPKPEEG